jgi:predicted nucleotidyltransferase
VKRSNKRLIYWHKDLIIGRKSYIINGMKTLEEIRETLKKAFPELRKKYLINKIGIFGSYARGEQTEESDIDILVSTTNEKLGLFALVNMKEDFEAILNHQTDVIIDEDLRKEFRADVYKDIIYL